MNFTRRHPWARVLFLPLVTLLMVAGCGKRTAPPPSAVAELVLLVTVEDLGAGDLGCGGAPRARTPHLDRLARAGTQAVDVLSPSLSTRAALATILTGQLPSRHGLDSDDVVLGPVRSLAEVLAAEGTQTAAFAGTGAADRRHGLGRGFQRHTAPFRAGNDRVEEPWCQPGFADASTLARELQDWTDDERNGPAFGWVHLGDRVDGSPADADRAFAELQRSISRAGPVLIVVTSPHGSDAERSVPLLVRGPRVPVGTRPGPSSLEDVTTILAGSFAGAAHLARALEPAPGNRARPDQTLTPADPPALTRARNLDRKGFTLEARAAYLAALQANPRRVNVRWRESELARRTAAFQEAADGARAVLAEVAEHPEARVLLARLLLAQHDTEHALEMIEPVLAADPRHAGALAVRSDLASGRNDPAAAVRDLRAALAAAGHRTDDLVAVGAGLSRAGLHGDAIRTVRRAVELGDQSENARYTLAFTLERAERYPEAVDEYVRLINEHPRYLPPYRNLGALMARDSEVERAIRLWERGLEFHPEDPGLLANVEAARRALGLATLGGRE